MALTPAYFETDRVTGQEQRLTGSGGPLVSNSVWLANHAQEHNGMGMLSYTGQVASRCMLPTTGGSSNKQLMARSRHVAHDTISSVQLVYANWYMAIGGAETAAGAASTFRASIEYPIGTVTRVLFSGAVDGAVSDGATLVSDSLTISIPRGAVFYVRTWQNSPGGVLFANRVGLNTPAGSVPPSGEWWTYGVTTTDYTGATTNVNNQGAGNIFAPAAIIGQTTRPTFLLVGDSRTVPIATYETIANNIGGIGEHERSLTPSFGTINIGGSGDSLTTIQTGFVKRVAFVQYCSNVIVSLGINDFTAGRTYAQAIADLASLITTQFSSKKVFAATVAPKSASTDLWATTDNQTTDATSATARLAYNAALRTGQHTARIAGFVEIADAVESARDSGLWKVTGADRAYTYDGLHESSGGFQAIEDSRPYSKFTF